MRLQDQVCTLEQAKRLRELDVKKPAYFKWIEPRLLYCFEWEEEIDAPKDQYEFYRGWAVDDVETAAPFISADRHQRFWDPERLKAVHRKSRRFEDNHWYPAYNVAELGAILPFEFMMTAASGKQRSAGLFLGVHPTNPLPYYVKYCTSWAREDILKRGATEAQARAAMLIHLLTNKLIELPVEAALA